MAERFPIEVVEVLTESGWTESGADRASVAEAIQFVEDYVGQFGAVSESFAAATSALDEFGGLTVLQDGDGIDFRRRPFIIDPRQSAATTETLADFGTVLGTRLFPLGMEGDHDAILAIAENGAVFSLDHAGEWHLGESMDEALVTLITGRSPERVTSAGTW